MRSAHPLSRRPLDRSLWLALLLLVLLGAALYGHVRNFPFVTSDDRSVIVENPAVTSYFQSPLSERLLSYRFGYAVPVAVASYAVDWALWSGDAGGFHTTSLAIHISCAVLLLLVLRRLVAPVPALLGAILFLVHPAQVEAFAFVSQRKDLLAGLFSLASLLLLLRGIDRPLRGRDAVLIVVVVLGAGLSKPSALLLGPALSLHLWFVRGRPRVGAERVLFVSLIGLAPLLFFLNRAIDDRAHLALQKASLTGAEHLSLMGNTILHYAATLVFPVDLAPKVLRPISVDSAAIAIVLLVACASLIALVLALRHRRPRLFLCLVWLGASYLPIANVLPVNRYAADCYLYLPMIAVALGFSLGLDRLLRRQKPLLRLVPLPLCVMALAALSVLGRQQSFVWRDEETLLAYVYLLYPEHPSALEGYTELLRRTGRAHQARALRAEFVRRLQLRRAR